MEFNSIHPLLSTFLTLHTLILLYAPSFFLRIVLSPVLNSTGIILLFLLKLGANERSGKESSSLESRIHDSNANANERLEKESYYLEQRFLDHDLGVESYSQDVYSMESSQVVERGGTRMEMDSFQVDTTMKFLKWNMKAPLEIIYEAYEGEEEEDEDNSETNMVSSGFYVSGFERYPSLTMYYPESETDSSSDDDFPMNRKWETHESMFFKWEMENDDREELIEISVDRYEKRGIEFCRAEEDNLIEIDIFPSRN
ncbi:hypothetical protein L1987_58591 [Smallanthus sonchifolius]|uniref:Uncharacterized protein n=1 Tax=Smallanthus sonchifolius TaxID=185202 RepID=A0ACB9DFZ1_9ASTR|nr:hypothetical protein L1987_58591 [Smallanthus sonchifolius]